jgi:mycothiol synthase
VPQRAELEIRPAELADAAAALEILNRVSLELYGEPEFTEQHVLVWWRDPKNEPWVAADSGGTIVGEVGISAHNEGRRMFVGAAGVPDVARRLLAFGEQRARDLGAPGAVARTTADAADVAQRAVLEEAGYRVIRHWFHMAIDLAGAPDEPAWPDGVRTRPFVAGVDDRAVYDADNESFADHWDFAPRDFERWRLWTIEKTGFDPGLWVLADADGELAGFSINEPHRSGLAGVGRVASLGVRRPWRKRGIGLALLLESFRRLRAAGFTEARLEVDAENTTGAVRLYERAGMSVSRTYLTFQKQLERG